MKSFKEIAEYYQSKIDEAKFKKKKIWKADEKGNLKKTIIKFCADSDGQKAAGYKLVDGKKCAKMTPAEIMQKKKTSKKIEKTKKKNATKNAKRAEILAKKRATKMGKR